jgi:hypothetical protein
MRRKKNDNKKGNLARVVNNRESTSLGVSMASRHGDAHFACINKRTDNSGPRFEHFLLVLSGHQIDDFRILFARDVVRALCRASLLAHIEHPSNLLFQGGVLPAFRRSLVGVSANHNGNGISFASRQTLPKLFRHERHKGMQHFQSNIQACVQHVSSPILALDIVTLGSGLDGLQIHIGQTSTPPVRDRLGGSTKVVRCNRSIHILQIVIIIFFLKKKKIHLHVLSERGQDPSVDSLLGRCKHMFVGHKVFRNGQGSKPNNIPQLIAEMTIRQNIAHIQVDIATLSRVVAKSETHRISATFRNPLNMKKSQKKKQPKTCTKEKLWLSPSLLRTPSFAA